MVRRLSTIVLVIFVAFAICVPNGAIEVGDYCFGKGLDHAQRQRVNVQHQRSQPRDAASTLIENIACRQRPS